MTQSDSIIALKAHFSKWPQTHAIRLPAREGPGSWCEEPPPGVAENHVLRAKDLWSCLRQDLKKYATYDSPEILNSGEQASELSEKRLHVMVIIFQIVVKNSRNFGIPKMTKFHGFGAS